jgi:hypothetical protein
MFLSCYLVRVSDSHTRKQVATMYELIRKSYINTQESIGLFNSRHDLEQAIREAIGCKRYKLEPVSEGVLEIMRGYEPTGYIVSIQA